MGMVDECLPSLDWEPDILQREIATLSYIFLWNCLHGRTANLLQQL